MDYFYALIAGRNAYVGIAGAIRKALRVLRVLRVRILVQRLKHEKKKMVASDTGVNEIDNLKLYKN